MRSGAFRLSTMTNLLCEPSSMTVGSRKVAFQPSTQGTRNPANISGGMVDQSRSGAKRCPVSRERRQWNPSGHPLSDVEPFASMPFIHLLEPWHGKQENAERTAYYMKNPLTEPGEIVCLFVQPQRCVPCLPRRICGRDARRSCVYLLTFSAVDVNVPVTGRTPLLLSIPAEPLIADSLYITKCSCSFDYRSLTVHCEPQEHSGCR
ncbi:hypothetical protein OH77DRAFT_488311 [Trametes cingulata]|nr:hypothetical protein OH77DRAFT_488311 [Trametes cingulata]